MLGRVWFGVVLEAGQIELVDKKPMVWEDWGFTPGLVFNHDISAYPSIIPHFLRTPAQSSAQALPTAKHPEKSKQ